MKLFIICLFLLGFSSAQQVLIPHGSQQFYELTNKVTLGDLGIRNNVDISYTFKVFLKVNSVWNSKSEQLLEVTFGEPTVNDSPITQIPDRPFYISLVDNVPQKVIAHTSKDQSLLNLERGIASMLMVRYEEGPLDEVDVSGHCKTIYKVKSSTELEKEKTDCSLWDLKVNYRTEKPLDILQESHEKIKFKLSADGILMLAESSERHAMALTSKPDAGSVVSSQLRLQHLATGEEEIEQLQFKTLDEAVQSLLEWYRVFDIEADSDGALSELKDASLKAELSKYVKVLDIDHIGKKEMALAFVELLPVARLTKKSEFVEILQSHKGLHFTLVDLLGAVQTFDAYEAINEVFDYSNKKHFDLLEKYFQALSVGTHPDKQIIESLFEKLKSPEKSLKNIKLKDTMLQTLAAMVRQFGLHSTDQLAIDVREFILSELESCKDGSCKTMVIRALQNLQDLATVPQLLDMALKEEAKISVASMQALQSFPVVHFTQEQRKQFAAIFYQIQKKYDSSARAIALEILFAMKPTKEQLGHLLDYLNSNDRQYEMKTYVIQKLKMIAEKCPRFRAVLLECLKERPEVNNYHIIAQKGLTTVLTRELSSSPFFNESLLSTQEINSGILKKGSVELILSAGKETTSTFKLGIFTSGLGAFIGDDGGNEGEFDEESEEDGPATAGMEIEVQGTLLRPLIFFSGQSELMGHVWSGTASDPTPAFQATTLAQDHELFIILASGATLYLRVLGGKSVDLNGKVTSSIWNRNANTEIQQSTGNAIVGQVIVGFTYAHLESKFILTNEPQISLQADIDFYSQIKLCMQLQRPEMTLTHSSARSLHVKADKTFSKKSHKKLTFKSPGKTLALNQKNNEMCNSIFE